MKRYLNNFLIFILFLTFICFQSNSVFALDKVDISIYYERIDEVINLSLTNPDSVDIDDNAGYYLKYSKDGKYAYKVQRTKVSTEAELFAAMGVSSESELKYGQQCILAGFRAATSNELRERAGASYEPSLELNLIDTSNDGSSSGDGYSTRSTDTEPNIRKDFWPCSNASKKTITISDVLHKYSPNTVPSGAEAVHSAVFHEYAHYMDNCKIDARKYNADTLYGLDGTHFANEITNPRISMIEGWAEYNEMIESNEMRDYYYAQARNIKQESTTQACVYTNISPENTTFDNLLNTEVYNAMLLYRISEEFGKDIITEVFVDTRWNHDRDLKAFLNRLVSLHPECTQKVCSLIDEVFLGKASNNDIISMVGNSDAVYEYLNNRGSGSNNTNTYTYSSTNTNTNTNTGISVGSDNTSTYTYTYTFTNTNTNTSTDTGSSITTNTYTNTSTSTSIYTDTDTDTDTGNSNNSFVNRVLGRLRNIIKKVRVLFVRIRSLFDIVIDGLRSVLTRSSEEKDNTDTANETDTYTSTSTSVVTDDEVEEEGEKAPVSEKKIKVKSSSTNPFKR